MAGATTMLATPADGSALTESLADFWFRDRLPDRLPDKAIPPTVRLRAMAPMSRVFLLIGKRVRVISKST
ncbi:hypothetical protein [Moraxella lacunata]|uniref:hypothetical protein n=1 Tax=Moraxella lacunata TaxID=477 RepID=UPI003EE34FCD